MALDFPNAPTVGQIYPLAPPAGTPQWRWTGSLWESAGISMIGAVRFDAAQVLNDVQRSQARQNIYAAPFDAMSCQNIVINGDMQVSQTNGNSTIPIVNNSNAFITDQWTCGRNHAAATAAFSANQGAGGYPIGTNYLNMTASAPLLPLAAGDWVNIGQSIEGLRLARLWYGSGGAQAITLGFWIWASVIGTAAVSIRNPAGNRSYVANFNINAVNTWEFKTIVIPGDLTGTWPTANAVGAYLTFCFAAGATFRAPQQGVWTAGNYFATPETGNFFTVAGNVINITGVIMLPGSHVFDIGSSFRLIRPWMEELALCRRYLYKLAPPVNAGSLAAGVTWSGTLALCHWMFPVSMRVPPTCSGTGSGGLQARLNQNTVPVSSVNFNGVSTESARIDVNFSSGGITGQGCTLEVAVVGSGLVADARM